ncbi:MAG: hypothetical protein WCH39_06190 [Schlesneria sp.]
MFDSILAKCLRCSDFVALTADADALAFGRSMVTQTSSALWSYDQIVKDSRFGRVIADALYSAIVSSGSPAAAMLYVNYGIDLSLDATQAGLDQIAASVPALASACAELKSLGCWQVSVFASRGVTWSPAVADITFHRAANVAADRWEQLVNNTVPTLLSQGKNWAEIKTAINGVF